MTKIFAHNKPALFSLTLAIVLSPCLAQADTCGFSQDQDLSNLTNVYNIIADVASSVPPTEKALTGDLSTAEGMIISAEGSLSTPGTAIFYLNGATKALDDSLKTGLLNVNVEKALEVPASIMSQTIISLRVTGNANAAIHKIEIADTLGLQLASASSTAGVEQNVQALHTDLMNAEQAISESNNDAALSVLNEALSNVSQLTEIFSNTSEAPVLVHMATDINAAMNLARTE